MKRLMKLLNVQKISTHIKLSDLNESGLDFQVAEKINME